MGIILRGGINWSDTGLIATWYLPALRARAIAIVAAFPGLYIISKTDFAGKKRMGTYTSARVPSAYVPPTMPTHLFASAEGWIGSISGAPARAERGAVGAASAVETRVAVRIMNLENMMMFELKCWTKFRNMEGELGTTADCEQTARANWRVKTRVGFWDGFYTV
jgi:hypothetical protein